MRDWAASSWLAEFFCAEGGQDVVEYGLLIVLIAVIVLVGVRAFGNQVEPGFLVLTGRITTIGT